MPASPLFTFNEIVNLFPQFNGDIFVSLPNAITEISNIIISPDNKGKLSDLQVINEIQSSLKLISGIINIDSEAMKNRHITEAETNLLKNISLDVSLITANHYNKLWVCYCYIGLTLVSAIRKESEEAVTYFLRAYTIFPDYARAYCIPFYKKVFEDHCKDLYDEYDEKITHLPEYTKTATELKSEIKKKSWIKWTATGVGVVSTLFGKKLHLPHQLGHSVAHGSQHIGKEISELEAKLNELPTTESLKAGLLANINQRCNEFAAKILEAKNL